LTKSYEYRDGMFKALNNIGFIAQNSALKMAGDTLIMNK
jgi:hypothetical protein